MEAQRSRLTEAVAFEFFIRCASKGCGEHDAVDDAAVLVGKRGTARTAAHHERAVLPRLLLLLLLVRVLHSKATACRLFVAVSVHSRTPTHAPETVTVVHTNEEKVMVFGKSDKKACIPGRLGQSEAEEKDEEERKEEEEEEEEEMIEW